MKPASIQHLLLTTDLSDASWEALGPAVELCQRLGASLTVLSIIEEPAYLSHLPMSEQVVDMLREAEPTVRARIAERLKDSPVAAEVVVPVGRDSPRVIVETAQERGCDLIVMSTHGRSGWSHLLLGSVAERVLRTSPIPVLTIRAPAEEGAAR